MAELEARKSEIEARLREAPVDLPDVNPNVSEHYRREISRLTALLEDPEFCAEAAQDVRALIGDVVLTPGDKRGEVEAVLNGEIVAILDFAGGRTEFPFRSKVIPAVLAGPGFEPASGRI
jgi:hypothetical protein